MSELLTIFVADLHGHEGLEAQSEPMASIGTGNDYRTDRMKRYGLNKWKRHKSWKVNSISREKKDLKVKFGSKPTSWK